MLPWLLDIPVTGPVRVFGDIKLSRLNYNIDIDPRRGRVPWARHSPARGLRSSESSAVTFVVVAAAAGARWQTFP